MSINQEKKIISNKFNSWYVDRLSRQLSTGIAPGALKVSLKLNNLKLLPEKWIVEAYKYLKKQDEAAMKSFNEAGITDAINFAKDIYTMVESQFD